MITTTLNWKKYSEEKPEKDDYYLVLLREVTDGKLGELRIENRAYGNGVRGKKWYCSTGELIEYWAEITTPIIIEAKEV